MNSHKPDNDGLLMLRGILAMAIIWHHLGGIPLKVFGTDIAFVFWMPGRVIVWLFYVISGYGIYWGYRNQKYKFELRDSFRFYFNRAIRILPLFYLSVILTWVAMFYISPQELPDWQTIIRTMMFLDVNFNQGIFTFTPAWFIGVIVHFYLLAPILVKGYITLRDKFGLIATLCSLIILSVLCHRLGKILANSTDIRNIIGNASLFIFGFFAYDLYNDNYSFKEKLNKILKSRVSYAFILCYFEWIFYLYHKKSPDFWSYSFLEALVGLLGAILIVEFLLHTPVDEHKEILIVKAVKSFIDKVGKFSYGLYLWHGLVIMLVVRKMLSYKEPPYETASAFIGAYVVTVVFSYCVSWTFYYLLETPYNKLYKKRISQNTV